MIKYDQYLSTLSQISADTSHKDKDGNLVVMTSSTAQAIEFDTFLEDYLKAIYAKAAKTNSVDAFCLLDGKYCLIEFKNGEIDKEQVRNKITSSVSSIVFKDNISPEYFRDNSMFILVYNKNSSGGLSPEAYEHHNEYVYLLKPKEINPSVSKDIILNHISNKSGQPIVRFKLKMFKNLFFSQVMTMDKEIFEEYIKNKTITIPEN